jgi:regulator of sigma E protease
VLSLILFINIKPMSILIFLIILLVLVISHEFGHFIIAKKSGIRVDEFSFGFPPKLFGKKIGETSYNFNALPFGGYVKIYGENPDDETINGPLKDRSFSNKPSYIKMFVLLGGVAMNFLVAWLLLSIGFMSGLPTAISNSPNDSLIENQNVTITSVVFESPAEKAGLKIGDRILSLETETDSTKLLSSNFDIDIVQKFINNHPDQKINISLIRGHEPLNIVVIPKRKTSEDPAMIGISMDIIGTLKLPFHTAIWEGLKLTVDVTLRTIVGFYNLIRDAILGQADMAYLTGPIGIVGVVGDATKFGFIYLLSFTAFISINLAVINLIPFPALDGGRLLFLLIEKIKGSRIKPEIANWANSVGFIMLMMLMIFITYKDILKIL